MGGAVDDAIFPIRFEIEHVRVYRQRSRGGSPSGGTAAGPGAE